MLFLLIETGTAVCSIALARDTQIVALRENKEGRAHAQVVAPFINEVLEEQCCTVAGLDAVAVSEGPGSYTGLRVGVSTAKGICFGAQKPLIAVNSLLSLAHSVIDNRLLPSPDCLIAPMIDARRMEVYTALFDAQGNQRSGITAEIIDEKSFAATLAQQPVLFIGDGAGKCQTLLQHPNALFADVTATAAGMLRPAINAFAQRKFVDIAYFEPLYLKDFVATVAKKKIV
ncbi:MAG: tRNA (adenosine(37)-N6)-threonylcarbamoyltransferase complex dimerization subunit type 1 TsaB [Prevotellaceae bacterium]|jgi:tRNA threonylcarbamoyladenosine biosynthesis protein TsaB|nr:tRNA (adenosine(37)-N6)-threonylcarbamoyltransferase complex dimerization subunit type 1 TsaB [Prevotellaceae bacterium]